MSNYVGGDTTINNYVIRDDKINYVELEIILYKSHYILWDATPSFDLKAEEILRAAGSKLIRYHSNIL